MNSNKKEITFELTNYCPENCNYCSSKTTNNITEAIFLDIKIIKEYLKGNRYEHIILSGGEPLAHPQFYNIFNLCKQHTEDVIVYSNLITHRIYNANVIDGVYLEANITLLPETSKIHILKRIKQGREANRPEVHISRNYIEDCSCEHRVIIPDGTTTLTPCNKDSKPLEKEKYENQFYIIGAHGVGKSTLLTEIKNKLNFSVYENLSSNPYKYNIYKRQLWRLMKYKSDEELIHTINKKVFVCRCYFDWLIYTKTFKELNWINKKEYDNLIKKFNELFNDLPSNIIYLNPDKNWSKKRILERWEKQGIKWREDDFTYYEVLRKNYNNFINSLSGLINITEIQLIDKTSRLNYIKNYI